MSSRGFAWGLLVSGLAWLAVYLTLVDAWANPPWPMVLAILGEVFVGFLVVTLLPASSLVRGMVGLWLLAIVLLWGTFMFEFSAPAIGVAILFGTIAFGLWVVPPVVALNTIWQARSSACRPR